MRRGSTVIVNDTGSGAGFSNRIEKPGRRQHWNSLEGIENQQVLVSGDKAIRFARKGNLQQLVIIGITAQSYRTLDLDHDGNKREIGHEGLSLMLIDIPVEFGPRQACRQLVEQLARSQQRGVVQDPRQAGGRFAER
jgi:hypothetical protein